MRTRKIESGNGRTVYRKTIIISELLKKFNMPKDAHIWLEWDDSNGTSDMGLNDPDHSIQIEWSIGFKSNEDN